MYAIIKPTIPLTAQERITEVVVEEATKVMENKIEARRSLWGPAAIVASLGT
jgi:hypothetical protein